MPLNPPGLKSGLQSLFAEPPATVAACAQAWADAVGAYAADIVPASTTVAAAAAAMVTPMQSAFESSAAAPIVDAAFMAFATTVAAGMLPAFTGFPPPEPLAIAAQLAFIGDTTHADAAEAFALLLDLWFKTGTASLVAPPGPTITWT